jgi:hypothetical protein
MVSTKSQIKKTTNLVTGIVGLSVGSSVAAGLPGMAGTIVRTGALPMAGLGLMAEAAPSEYSRSGKARKIKGLF